MDTTNPDLFRDVEKCQDHTGPNMPGCLDCDAELQGMEDVLTELQSEAVTRSQGLAAMGVGMPPEVAVQIKMDLIVDTLFQDAKNRYRFEGELGRRTVETLKGAQAQATKDSLTKGVRGQHSPLIMPNGARSKGL